MYFSHYYGVVVKILNLTLESGEILQPTWATEGEFVSPII
jgi:hypothetical protein